MDTVSENTHSSFIIGFTWGLIAGASGYFLFATEQGKKVRQDLSEEWQKQTQDLATHSDSPHQKVSLRAAIAGVIASFTSLESESNPVTAKVSLKKSEPKSVKTAGTAKSKRFKGI